MTNEELLKTITEKRKRLSDNSIQHEKIEVSKELLSLIKEAFDAFFEMGDDTKWKKMSDQDFYFVCKVSEWLDYASMGYSGVKEQTDQEFFSTILEICDNEDYLPPDDIEWEKLDEGNI